MMNERLSTPIAEKDTRLRQPLPTAISAEQPEEPSPEELQSLEEPLTRYFRELRQIPLLSREKERQLGAEIFRAKLALRNLVTLKTSGLIPPQQKFRVENVLTDKRTMRLLDTLNGELIQKRWKTMENKPEGENEPEDDTAGKDVSSERQFLEDVNTNDEMMEKKIQSFRAIEAAGNENQALTEFIQQQMKFAKSGLEAADLLITSNLRLAVAWAKIERRKIRGALNLQEVDSFAREGLIMAVDRFDYRKGFKFSTFAVWWIRQTIIRGIMDSSSTIRVPVNTQEALHNMFGLQRAIMQQTGEEKPIKQIIAAHAVGRKKENLLSALEAQRSISSLDQPLSEENGDVRKLGDFIPGSENIEETAITALMQARVRQALQALTEREREILTLRFGLDDNIERSLEEVGKTFGITRERVRQIQAKAFRKLKRFEELTNIANATFGKEDK